jgi:predicted O-methyltransferase YrrM
MYRRLDHLLIEVRKSAFGAALMAGAIIIVVGSVTGLSGRLTTTIGASTAMMIGVVLLARSYMERQVRNSADSAMIFSLLGPRPPALGTWAIEGDFGQLVAREVASGATSIVECGSGTTTLIVAACLRAIGSGHLYSLEHDPAYAQQTAEQLQAAGLAEWVDIIVAPLTEQPFGSASVEWYEPSAVAKRLPPHIDLLIVDGPPSTSEWARWPAIEILHDRLVTGAVTLLDDGRQRRERRAAFRWQSDHPDLQLFWHDTVKGSWKLVKLADPPPEGRGVRVSREVIRWLYPRPSGFGRWPVRR